MPKQKPSATKDFISGGIGGMCTVAAGHPLDTIKVNMFYLDLEVGGKRLDFDLSTTGIGIVKLPSVFVKVESINTYFYKLQKSFFLY